MFTTDDFTRTTLQMSKVFELRLTLCSYNVEMLRALQELAAARGLGGGAALRLLELGTEQRACTESGEPVDAHKEGRNLHASGPQLLKALIQDA